MTGTETNEHGDSVEKLVHLKEISENFTVNLMGSKSKITLLACCSLI